MKKIIMLAASGLFLAFFLLLLQDREDKSVQMEGLFSKNVNVINGDVEKMKEKVLLKKEVDVLAPEISGSLEMKAVESNAVLRNKEIKRALQIKPREVAREEVKKVLARYREKEKGDKSYRSGTDNYEKIRYRDWSEKRQAHDDDDYEEEDDD